MKEDRHQVIIDNHDNGVVHIHQGLASPVPKREIKATAAISEDTDEWIDTIVKLVSEATGSAKYGRSTVINEALEFYRHFYSQSSKMIQNKDKLKTFMGMF